MATIDKYYQDLKKEEFQVLSAEKQKDLIETAQKNYDEEKDEWTELGLEARNKLLECNYRLVYSVVKKIVDSRDSNFMDCVNEGYMVMCQCIIRYSCERNTCFSTYATRAIERRIWRVLRRYNTVVIPAREVAARSKKEQEAYATGSIDALYNRMTPPVNHMRSLNSCGFGYDQKRELIETVHDWENPADNLEEKELYKLFAKSLGCLTEKEKYVILQRYFSSDKRTTLKTIGQKIGKTTERVRQIEEIAKKKMLNYIESQ